jgi:exonuclease SbcC
MFFSQDIVESYKRLKEALGNILEGQSPELTVSQAYDYPLLVLETSRDSVGFAVVNGAPEPAFASAYDSFKHLYRQKHTAWKERNLSFVICRSEPESTHDAFFSSVETDVYFCRKYVVWLRHNQNELVRELLRLPFLPLPEDRAGGILRPPSAQTLLQNMNVSAQLARQIIVPLEYSANRILNQLLTGKELLTAIGTRVDPNLQHQAQPTERTRIRNVEIEAFRAYRKRQEFDVDADLVVFYGPNGLGKTSFFDALDYVCTGRIGRLCRRRIRQNDFMDLARHLGSSVSEGCVSMQISQGATVSSVSRSVANWGTALIGKEKYDRAGTLQFLTSSHWGPKKARIENLERLFRATHLFGQSDPELLVEFEQASALSPDLVHRMLALDDYASGLAKATIILAELDKRIEENKQQMRVLDTQADKVQLQIKALSAPQDAVEAGKQLRDMATRLVRDLRSYINVTIDDIEPSQASAREWRAMTESALKDAQDRLRLLQSTESGFAQFDENRSALKHIIAELSKLEVALNRKNPEHRRQEEARKKLTGSLEQERAVLAQAKLRLRALAELGGLQEVFQKTKSSLKKWQQELKRIADETDATAAELQQLLPEADNLRTRTAELREAVQAKLQQVQALAAIQDGLPPWERNRANITNLQQAAGLTLSAIEKTSTATDELKTDIVAKEKELSACEKEYGELTVNQLKLTRLLDEIEAYVENGICPTCGIDHKSKVALIKRIHAQKQTRPDHVEALAKHCAELRKALNQGKASLATLTGEAASKRGELEKTTSKLTEVRESFAAFEHIIAEAGLPLDQQLAVTVAHKLIEEKKTLQLLQETLANLESELTRTAKRINELEQKRAQQTEGRKRAGAAIEPLEQECAALRAKAEASGLSLDTTPEELTAQTSVLTSRKAAAEERIGELTPQIETIMQTANEVDRQISGLTEEIKTFHQDKKRLEETLRRYEENAAYVIDRNALSLDAISEQRRLAAERVDCLDGLRRRCITFERTVDAAHRSAMLAEFEAQAQSLAKQKQTLAEAAGRMSTVKKWFTSVKDALDTQSSSAVANHVDAFGPLTTLIQKRLRAVYGFGDINLLAERNSIRVVVGWGTKRVKPADYFSESQKQILMLSIFLASRLTQTWSGFAPVMMDDPVTHFDDLNAFGFVELIRSLVSNSQGKHQFFISTCEDRLFELMLKKFSNVNGGAKFYRFEGIGGDGPIIRNGR